MAEGRPIRVTVACSPGPRQVLEWSLELPAGATVRTAIDASPIAREWPDGAAHEPALFVWGRAARPDQLLHDGDRVEWLRGLRVDPKVARRERFRKQGSRAAGLFARRG
ncbi:RnfH family protein [Ramlibacter sp. AW1]|uniref:UPF0125 protein JI739_00320 n=1 Tax=Ramlibacter aurantiacus TaxID=2801330 RepID=A0A937D2Z9_9BURK|nr:RnfH family protein [Ramlibacter aurantiacus]MBL0418777.1 RnfH family protein [Ramlibacter aurantiacus]